MLFLCFVEDEEWKSVSVLLDGQESTLEFKDLSPIEVMLTTLSIAWRDTSLQA